MVIRKTAEGYKMGAKNSTEARNGSKIKKHQEFTEILVPDNFTETLRSRATNTLFYYTMPILDPYKIAPFVLKIIRIKICKNRPFLHMH